MDHAAAGAAERGRDRTREREQAATRSWPPLWLCGLHLGALWALAFVQPLFGLLGGSPAFFVARDNSAGDILIFALVFALLPPLILTAIVAIAGRVDRRLGHAVQLVFVALLAGALLGQFVKGLSPSPAVMFPLALVLGILAAALYARVEALRTLLSVLSPAPLVVLALLLIFSPVSGLVFGSDSAKAAGPGTTARTPVVLMIFDELPTISLMKGDKSVDARRYPSFARLAKQSTWYRNATSVADGTYVAVPAILTGLRPNAELPTSRSYSKSLFSLLGKPYKQFDQEPITKVCPPSLCAPRARPRQKTRLTNLARDLKVVEGRLLLPDGLADDLPPIDRDWEDFAADNGDDGLASASTGGRSTKAGGRPKGDITSIAGSDIPSQRVRAGRSVVETMKPLGRPALWMVHYVIPHVPWRFLPNGAQYVVDGPTIPGLDDQTWGKNRFLLSQAYQRDFLMTKFADNLLGEAITQMKRSGLWDKALFIVVADHGGAIGPSEQRRPVTKQNFGSVASVPMFVKLPGQKAGKVSETFTTTMDVVPTIAKVLGIKTDWKFDGTPVDEPHTAKLLQQRNGREAKLVGMAPQQFVRSRDARLARQDREFAPGNASLWKVGPRDDLLGRSAASLHADGRPPTRGASAKIANSSLYRHVRKSSGVIPIYVTGTTRGVADGTDLAVAVNGRIRATGESYAADGERRFSALVPPSTLRRGRNRIELFALTRGGARLLGRTG